MKWVIVLSFFMCLSRHSISTSSKYSKPINFAGWKNNYATYNYTIDCIFKKVLMKSVSFLFLFIFRFDAFKESISIGKLEDKSTFEKSIFENIQFGQPINFQSRWKYQYCIWYNILNSNSWPILDHKILRTLISNIRFQLC